MNVKDMISFIERHFRVVVSKRTKTGDYLELRISKIRWEKLKKELKENYA